MAIVVAMTSGWLLLRKYTSTGARECVALYNEAQTGVDSARVDSTIPPAGMRETDPRSCGMMRRSSRWQ